MRRSQYHQFLACKKNIDGPCYTIESELLAMPVIGMDHFPYTQFYQGIAASPYPIIHARESGLMVARPRMLIPDQPVPKTTMCFQKSCSNFSPCIDSLQATYTRERDAVQKIDQQCKQRFI